MAIRLAAPETSAWKSVIPEASGRDVLAGTSMVANRFVTQWMTDAHEILKVFALDGTFEREIALPAIGIGRRLHRQAEGPRDLLRLHVVRHPGAVYRYDFATGASTVFRQPKVEFDPADFETVQVFYPTQGRHEDPDVPHATRRG